MANGLILDQVSTSCSEGEGPLRTFLACLGAARATQIHCSDDDNDKRAGGAKNKGPFVVGSERFGARPKPSHRRIAESGSPIRLKRRERSRYAHAGDPIYR